MNTFVKVTAWLLGGLTLIVAGVAMVNAQIVASVDGETLVHASQYRDGKFLNTKVFEQPGLLKTLQIAKRYFTEPAQDKAPLKAMPVEKVSLDQLGALSHQGVHFIKLGHSSLLLKVYGEYWLLDPVFSERASPFSFLGPKRFHQAPIGIDELPVIDKVLISHNHYDHLDKASIKKLVAKTKQFLVPLGVEVDLQKWGVAADAIVRFDWWQELQTDNALIAFAPTQHFSGRGIGDGNTTLWGSWVIKTAAGSIYFSGDSGYFDGFKQIGAAYGPFDVAFIETGAYDNDWADIHMTPEQSVQAHVDVKGQVMVPVHNGTFDLAFHSWYDPLLRVSAAARQANALLLTPIFGQPISLATLKQHVAVNTEWWHSLMPEPYAVVPAQ
ncbi:hydrolase [Cellvibrio mixtus]|uniref:Hydrolase n=1 Tax=Cellvibrio mixtus TaxID=39650 RepID=A0A266Q802_9GAMM|nr:MBL fold metallo-hydrolase [Cellvibrio mixtus]OZY85930.1 hydrolase [Cellvibrio mixtus]